MGVYQNKLGRCGSSLSVYDRLQRFLKTHFKYKLWLKMKKKLSKLLSPTAIGITQGKNTLAFSGPHLIASN
jgi:hypothetical protein